MRAAFLLASLIVLASCSSRPEPKAVPPSAPPPAPKSAPAPPAAKPVSSNWEDWPATSGDWVYRQDKRGSIALFGPMNGDALFAVRCDRERRRIYLTRAGQFPEGETGRMTLRATSGLQSYTVSNTGGTPLLIGSELAVSDPHLDAMAFSRGKFLVTIKGADDLVIPSWPELTRVVEDCRAT